MRIVDRTDPTVLELKSEVVGCVVLAGLVFAAAGGAVLALALGTIDTGLVLDPDLKTIALVIGCVGVLLGLVFIGGRSGKTLDRHQRTLATWSGLFVPLRRKVQRLDGYTRVALAKEVRRSKNSSTTVYPVRLVGTADRPLQIDSTTDYLEARRLAEAVAKTLHWPMSDSSSGEEVVREPQRLDESLRERLRRLGERVEVSPRPATTRAVITATSSEVTAEIPGLDGRVRKILAASVVLVALGVGFAFFGAPSILFGEVTSLGDLTQLLPLALFVAVPLIIVVTKVRSFHLPVTIVATRAGLRLDEGGKITEIPGDELEELTIAGRDLSQVLQARPDGSLVVDPAHLDTPRGAAFTATHGQPPTIPPAVAGIVQALSALAPDGRAILARSDRASIRFAGGLSTDELSYLYSAIMKVLTD